MADQYPFASQAQRRKWEQLVKEGRVTAKQFELRDQATGDVPLPERTSPRVRTVGKSRAADAAKLGRQRY